MFQIYCWFCDTSIIPVYVYNFVLDTINLSAIILVFLNIFFYLVWYRGLVWLRMGSSYIKRAINTSKKTPTLLLFLKHGLWIIDPNINKLCQSKYETDMIWEYRRIVNKTKTNLFKWLSVSYFVFGNLFLFVRFFVVLFNIFVLQNRTSVIRNIDI